MEEARHLPNLTKATVLAGGVFIIDSFVINTGALGLIAILMAPWLIFRTIKARGDAALYKRHLTVTCMYVASGMAVLVSIYLNNSIAVKRAGTIIDALTQYRAELGEYPADVYDLVPDFIEKIPRAKYSYANQRFTYEVEEGRHVLSFGVLPPSGRSYYVMEDGKWGFKN